MFEKPPRATEHCRHYSYEGGPRCARSVDLSGVKPDGAAAQCMPAPGRTCIKREEYTDAERAEWRAWALARVQRMTPILAAIPDEGDNGRFACPACKTGRVMWSRARSNGHIWASCSTPNCFSVIQ